MKIHEYNEMMAYLTRPAPKKVAGLMEEYYGSDQLKYQEAVKNGFQGTFEEYLQWMRQNAVYGGRIGFKRGKRALGERRMYAGRMMTEDQIEAKKATRLVPKQEGMTWDKKTKSFRPRKIFTETMTAAERTEKFTPTNKIKKSTEKTSKKIKDFVEQFKLDNNGRAPSITELMDEGFIHKNIHKYLEKGKDFTAKTKQEAGKLGGAKPTGITEVSKDIINEVVDLRQRGIYTGIETSPAGSKSIRLNITDPKIKNAFKNISLPATAENLEKIKNEVKRIVDSNIYKEKIIPFQTSEEKRALKRFKEAMYKKQDPFGVYKALQKYKTEKLPGTMSKEIVIQHGQPKFTTQTLSRFGLIPAEVNISPEIEKIERIRNNNLKIAMSKLNNPNRSIADKKKIIEQFNDTMKGLRGQLKGTPAQGLVNFELLDIDAKGNVKKLKDAGFNPKKGLAYGEKLGELDLSKITKEQADEIINLGKRKIDNLVKPTSALSELASRTGAGVDPVLLAKAGYEEAVKPIAKVAGKAAGPVLKTVASPLGAAGFAGWTIADNLREGKSLPDSVVDKWVGVEMLFPEVARQASARAGSLKGMEKLGGVADKILKLGRVGRMFTPVGAALTTAGLAKDYYRWAKDEIARLEKMEPDERKAYNEMMMDETAMYEQGGRVGFAKGSPKSPGRRAFLKGITALAALPIVGRFFKLSDIAKRATTYTGPTIEKIKGMPEWFPGLVKKLFNEGEDVTKTASWKERQVVKRGTLEGGDDVDMFYDLDTGDVSINVTPGKRNYETTSGAYNKEYSLEYTKGQADEMTKGKKPPDEFGVAEIEGTMDQQAMDIDWEGKMTTVDGAMSDLTELEAFAKNKTTTQIHKKKGTKPKDVFPDYDYNPLDDY